MIGVWFTFGPDGPALVESVAAFRDAGGTKVAIFDDDTNPLADSVVSHIAPDLRERTTWPRGGNLRDWPCILGELDCMERAAGQLGGDAVLKIDSDTLVLSLDWIDPSAPMSGFIAGYGAHIFGMAYHLRVEAVRTVRSSMLGRHRDPDGHLNEDRAISCEAMWRFGPQIHAHTWDAKLAGGWDFGRTPPERYATCQVITFGNRHLLTDIRCPAERRERVAVEMARFRLARAAKPQNDE